MRPPTRPRGAHKGTCVVAPLSPPPPARSGVGCACLHVAAVPLFLLCLLWLNYSGSYCTWTHVANEKFLCVGSCMVHPSSPLPLKQSLNKQHDNPSHTKNCAEITERPGV